MHNFTFRRMFLTFFFCIGFSAVYAQCPIVDEPVQTFCDTEVPTVADLTATDAGNGVVWYISQTSTTPLEPSAFLLDEETYYADDNSGTCGTREEVLVNIYSEPVGASFQGVCVQDPSEATLADLVVIGNNIQWYNSPEGGTALPLTTVLANNEIYYASQTSPVTGCETSRLAVMAFVGVVPVPTGDAVQVFCNDPMDQPTIADLEASSTNYWYASEFAVNPLSPSTPLVDGENYFASNIQPPCESSGRLEVTVQLETPPDAGTSGSIQFCSDDTSVNLFNELGGTPDVGGIWSPALSSGTGVFDPSVDTGGVYTYTVPGTGVCEDATATVTVTVNEAPDAGTDGSLEFCSNDAPADLFAALGGTPDTGGVWSPALASGTGFFDPAVDNAGTYTYTVTGTGPCEDATANVVVTVNQEPDAGLDETIELCTDDAPVDLFTIIDGTPDTGGTWSPALASGTGLFDPSVDTAGVYTYTVEGTGACADDSITVTVGLSEAPDAGTDGSMEFCSNDAPADLFAALGGTPDTGGIWSPALASGTGVFDPAVDTAGTYTYTVTGIGPCEGATANVIVTVNQEPDAGLDETIEFCTDDAPVDLFTIIDGTPDTGGTWSPALASGTGVFDPSVDTAGVYTYTVEGTGACADDSITVTVGLSEAPDAGTNGSMEFCSNSAPADLFAALGGTPDTGGIWSPALASGTGVFDPAVDTAGTYTYTVTGTGPCEDATATVMVTINEGPNAGTDGSIEFCSNDTPANLFDELGGTPDTGGTWSPALASGTGIFDPTVDTAGTYTYTVGTTGSCGTDTATVTVTTMEAPDAGTDGSIEFCSNDAPADLFDELGGTPDVGGTWSPALANGTGVFDPAMDTAGTYTYTVTGIGPCEDATATVTVTIDEGPNAGTDGSIEFCSNDTPANLFDELGGTPDTGGTWSPALASGTGVFDPTVDTAGTYTYTVGTTGSCGTDTATVTVTITEAPDAGTDGSIEFCSNDASADLFDELGGTPDAGGVWSPALASGTGVFDPAVDTEGTYTYTVSGTGPCEDATAIVNVTVNNLPNAGTAPSAPVIACTSGDNINLFDYLTDNPDTGGTWSPALASGTGIFDPSVDPVGVYTYTVSASAPCIGEDSVSLTVELGSTAAPSANDQVFCAVETATVADLSAEGENLTWYADATLSEALDETELLITTTYYVTQTDEVSGCESEAIPVDVDIIDNPAPTIVIDEDLCLLPNPSLSDLSEGIVEEGIITWYDAEGNILSLDESLMVGSTYYASFTGENGCESSEKLAVTIDFYRCNELEIPEGFSPNDDGQNDVFVIENLDFLYPNYELEIFNRYGNLVYEGNINTPAWDGTSNQSSLFGDDVLPNGVYFYVLHFNADGREPVQGTIYLNR